MKVNIKQRRYNHWYKFTIKGKKERKQYYI